MTVRVNLVAVRRDAGAAVDHGLGSSASISATTTASNGARPSRVVSQTMVSDDVVVIMPENVSNPHDLLPRQLRMPLAEAFGQTPRSFRYDLKRAYDRVNMQVRLLELLER